MTTTEARAALTSGRPEQVPVRVLDAARCHLGEGPAYDAASDTAWWFDILGRHLHEAKLDSGAVTVHALPVMASALAVVDDARHVLVAENGLHLRDSRSGAMTHLAPIEDEDARTRSNDARVHPSGTLWSSTMGRRAERGLGSIYAFRGGEARLLFTGLTIPNAICFSPDGSVGYFADTSEGRLYRVGLDPETALPLEEPRLLLRHEGPGGLDGAVTDAEGLIWCAIWGGGCVHAYSPAGRRVRRVAVPARQPSCPVFVGPRFDRLLVTSAWQDMGEAARAADPGHGQTFLLDVGTQGRAEPRMASGDLS
ncbi:SMP-30/gluconolactonase/LRE family protein [Ancylobacter sp. 6x-1]|uniref:SMP-30/gluconolactonase/LRE family protein n=1 Tax=Ancylobacter crimeensis TaxID=2579147 RepID=A0ABT0DCK5_9HYPH|nr:SMP-30/gluconolactonase/LRE family protein [Ancylobacter crimeensis]